MKHILFIPFLYLALLFSCSSDDNVGFEPEIVDEPTANPREADFKILSLGDSYTIGQSVCQSCRFPAQLKDSLLQRLSDSTFEVDIIAQTGWTTTNLQDAVISQNPPNDYDLVTLLIGVNNQFQGRPFSVYENEFPKLLDRAISSAGGDKNKVIVISIPDYAYTPYGQSSTNQAQVSQEINAYNSFAQATATQMNVTFVNITDITRQGLEDPSLVASDGLHPSEEAYTRFVLRILPIAVQRIQQ